MKVVKRDGSQESVKFDKISSRVRKLTYGLNNQYIDEIEIAKKVISGLYDGITTKQVDDLAAETAASFIPVHPDYSILASRICINRLHKTSHKKFSDTISELYNYIDEKTNLNASLISDHVYEIVMKHKKTLDAAIITDRDYNFDYFGFKTLEKSYLLKKNGQVIETPQHMYMRVAVGIWEGDIDNVLKTYDLLSQGFMTHATPTLFNAGTRRPQLSSCFLLTVDDDSIKGIYKTLSDVAMISQNAGGIGLAINNIRATGSYIKGTNGTSNGIIPMLRVFNETARYVDQGGGKRKGSFAIYLEPWHADVELFLDLRKNHGKEELRARDLFLALWIPDLFMKRVEANETWSLFSPDEVPDLQEIYGEQFEKAYLLAEEKGLARQTLNARDLWQKIVDSQIETGTPYMLYKDAANMKSNQQNLGTIKSSNLCTEIIEYTSKDEQAVCNLASIALPKFIKGLTRRTKSRAKQNLSFDHKFLYDVVYQTTVNLNKVVDINFYPTEETNRSNMRHRPIGIGVQGMADTFAILEYPFISDDAKKLNKDIFETIYFAAMTASSDLAKKDGHYESYEHSPLSKGQFQFNLWNVNEDTLSGMWDWKKLRKSVLKHGARNSLLIAPMPTASTAQILGNNESFEPFTSNIYTRRTLSGEYIVVNKHLVKELVRRDIWNEELKNQIIMNNGSVQGIDVIPGKLQEIYKTVWEISQKEVLNMSADRGVFICQSQSQNLFIPNVNAAKLTSAHFHAWKLGLKTGMYYLRTKAAYTAAKGLGIDTTAQVQKEPQQQIDTSEGIACSLDDPESCISCGS
jgi:ribonucleoside-diphosphate reductase alpha chain